LLEDDGEVGIYTPYQVREKETGELNTREAILIDARGRPEEISKLLPDRLRAIVGKRAAHLRWYCPKKYKKSIKKILLNEK